MKLKGLLGASILSLGLTLVVNRVEALSFVTPDPGGMIDTVTPGPGGIRLTGWTFDPDSPESVNVHAYVDNVFVGSFPASKSRPDVAQAYAGYGYGENHGFDILFKASPGLHNFCLYGINIGAGSNGLIGCRSANVASDPIGSFDSVVQAPGGVVISGWTLDYQTEDPLTGHVYVDNVFSREIYADLSRPDIGNAFPEFGEDHGFEDYVPVAPGAHTVCVYAINEGPGANALVGCKSITVLSSPYGSIDATFFNQDGLNITGWVIDPDMEDPIAIHVYVDGVFSGEVLADAERVDVGQAFLYYGNFHGFDAIGNFPPGIYNVCVYAINEGPGVNALLDCRSSISAI